MKSPNLYYPVAMILIILFGGYLVYTGYFQKPQVDMAAYQKLCRQYLEAPTGSYSRDQMQLLVYKINYLFPDAADKLTVPAERELKTCAEALAKRLKPNK
jgi:hypothetical protein